MDLKDTVNLIKNGIIRYKNKIFYPDEICDDLVITSSDVIFPSSVISKKTKIFSDRRYVVSESILLNEIRLGFRNRGDNTAINTEGGIITALSPIVKYSERDPKWVSLIGIDLNGNFKCGDCSMFLDTDYVSLSYCNTVKDFGLDDSDKVICDPVNKRPTCKIGRPRFILQDGSYGHLNITVNLDDYNNNKKIGPMSGGKVIIKCEDEIRLASGSIQTIYNIFKDMKERHSAEYLDLYIIDNGTYNIGLRTYDGILTTNDLKLYDYQNIIGGHFFYIK